MLLRRCVLLSVACLAAVGAAPPRTGPSAGALGEMVDVDLVTVEVRATDGSGQPVLGLGRRDFELLEDGRPVAITHFASIAANAATLPARGEAAVGLEATRPLPSAPGSRTTHLLVYVDDQHLRPAHRARVLRQVGAWW